MKKEVDKLKTTLITKIDDDTDGDDDDERRGTRETRRREEVDGTQMPLIRPSTA
jgi:hypothetical protein